MVSVFYLQFQITAKVILERIRDPLISTVDAEQAGFMVVRIIIEQCKEFRSDLHMIFIDFEKAFDSVNRNCIWQALRSRGIPEKSIAIIKAIKCRVLHRGKLYESFKIYSGVRKG